MLGENKLKCPNCGKTWIAEILYGYMEDLDGSLKKELDRQEVTLGGCCVTGNDPKWECNLCGRSWGKRDDDEDDEFELPLELFNLAPGPEKTPDDISDLLVNHGGKFKPGYGETSPGITRPVTTPDDESASMSSYMKVRISERIKDHILRQVLDVELNKKLSDSWETRVYEPTARSSMQQNRLSDRWDNVFHEIIGNHQCHDDFITESYESRRGDKQSLRATVSSNNIASEWDPYRIITQTITDEKSSLRYIKELKEDAKFLSMLNEPYKYTRKDEEDRVHAIMQDDLYESWMDELCKDGEDNAHAIIALEAKPVRAPLLAAYRKWGICRDHSLLASLLIKFFFKTWTVRRRHPDRIERVMSDITRMINENKSLKEIRKKLLTEDDHGDFMFKFGYSFTNFPHKDSAKYALQRITIHLGNCESDVPLNHLELEHVLPPDPPSTFNEDVPWNVLFNSLGNMTLLKDVTSAKQQNLSFHKKKSMCDSDGNSIGYCDSSLEINKKTVCDHKAWTSSIMAERETMFAKYAYKIWRLN